MFGSHDVVTRFRLHVAADLASTWAVFSDTDRFNRNAGLALHFEERLGDDGGVQPVGSMRRMGMTHTWDELPWHFEAPHWFRLERRFHGGPAEKVVVELRLTPTDAGSDAGSEAGSEAGSQAGTDVEYTVAATPRSPALRPVLLADSRISTRPQLHGALRAAGRAAEGQDAGYDRPPPALGAAARQHLQQGLATVADPRLARLIGTIVDKAPLSRQDRLHPLALAARAGLDPDPVVAAFLQATRGGALVLRWELNCPRCRAPKQTLTALGAAPLPVHCRSCNVRYDGAFPDAVNLSFRAAPIVRDFELPVECLVSPQRTPHVLLQDSLDARDLGDWDIDLAAGGWLLELGGDRVSIEANPAAVSDVATIIVSPDGCVPRQLRVRPGPVRLILRSRLPVPVQLTLRRRGITRPHLTLGRLLATPDALDLLPTDALAPGLTARVGHGAALVVDEVLGRDEELDNVAAWLREHRPATLRRTDGSLLATWPDAATALQLASRLVGDLRMTVGLDQGRMVTLTEGEHCIPCGEAVDRALDAARALGAGRVAVADSIAGLADLDLPDGASFVDSGAPGLRLLRDTGARDRFIQHLQHTATAGLPDRLGGRYALREAIGEGGQGAVWLVEDEESGQLLVAKLMRPDVLAHPRLVQFFVDEARIAATLDHPAIPSVLDAGIATGEQLWMVMERVEGHTLTARLAADGPLPGAEVVDIALQLLDALAAVHRAGLVHRDVKPDNIMLGHDGRVHLLDLGIARLAMDDDDPTLEGNILGTPLYLAPEQVRPPFVADGRADLYALGLVMHTALTGVAPFDGQDRVRVALARLRHGPPDLLQLRPGLQPASLAGVIGIATAREPADRYTDAPAMTAALDALA